MCGIAGFISGSATDHGKSLTHMLKQLLHRGTDATGVAFYERRDHVKLRTSLRSAARQSDLEQIVARHAAILDSRCCQGKGVFTFCEFTLDIPLDAIGALNWEIDTDPELCVHSIGPNLTIVKDEGSAEELQEHHQISPVSCTHGLGHVRLATESVEDINLAHPFTSYLMPELALAHNGQFTNYFNMRRSLEAKGVRFKTTNDSEMAAHFIAYQMTEKGLSLEDALGLGLDTFDGVFTLLVATASEMGAVRDRLGIKPMVHFTTAGGGVLFGSEQICLTPIVSDVFATEMEPGEVKTWRV
jgi:glutamine phosphoribosylpyrophosphate amidotransferase